MLILLMALTLSHAETVDTWRCTDESTSRSGKVWMVCGMADAPTQEADARAKALQNAINDFNQLCNFSSDCRGKDRTVEPMRSSCVAFLDKQGVVYDFRCYRLIKITVD